MTLKFSNELILGGGVFFNFGWLGKHPAFDLNKIYTKKQNGEN